MDVHAATARSLTRRRFLNAAGMGLGATALGALLPQNAVARTAAETARAKRVIFLFMAGAPSQVVCIYPNLTFVGKNPFRPFDDGMLELCAELEIECHDLLGAFPGEVDLLVYWAGVFDSHPNGECNQRVAEFLAPILNRL